MENTQLKAENDALKKELEAIEPLKEDNEGLMRQLEEATKLLQEDNKSNKDDVEATVKSDFGPGIGLARQFQELARKHVYVIAYTEEQQCLA